MQMQSTCYKDMKGSFLGQESTYMTTNQKHWKATGRIQKNKQKNKKM